MRNLLTEATRAMIADFKRSGLTLKDAQGMSAEPVLKDANGSRCIGVKLPYFTATGKRTQFYRVRVYEPLGFAAGSKKAAQRYDQPAGITPEIYLSRRISWAEVFRNSKQDVCITEGEKKTEAANKAFGRELPTIGLGGVWCFRSGRRQQTMLPVLEAIEWKERNVYIFYDSDANTNPDVLRAENALARELTMREAKVHICRIPALKGEKTGVDDYIVEKGADAFQKEVIDRAVLWVPAEALFRLNEEVLYVRDPGYIVVRQTMQRISPKAFKEHAFSHYEHTVITANGKTQTRSTAADWLRWPQRAEVQSVTYRPGQPRIIHDTPAPHLNVWPGWAVKPVAGDVGPWLALLDHLFDGARPEHRRWFEQWLAYPLQNPGVKLYTAAVLWSLLHGNGKSTIGYSMGRIYGKNFTEINDTDLFESAHNEWAENKQFAMGDEITGGGRDKKKHADRLKSIITRQELRLNIKYVPSFTVPDCINYYFTSNHNDAISLEENDRRLFIHEVTSPPEDMDWKRYYDWLDKGAGAAALFAHLRQLNLEGFNPAAHAPITEAKINMTEDTMGDLRHWVHLLRTDPAEALRTKEIDKPEVVQLLVDRQVWSARELVGIFNRRTNGSVSETEMGRALRRGGCKKVPKHDPKNDKVRGLLTEDGRQISTSLWYVRQGEPPDHLRTLEGVRRQYGTERGIERVPRTYQAAGKKF